MTNDLPYAVRALVHRPGVALAVVGTLALGVGLNVAAFCVVNGLLLKGPPYPESSAILQIQRASKVTALTGQVSGADFERWRTLGQPFESLAGYRTRDAVVGVAEDSRTTRAVEATAGLFDVLKVHPTLGREFGVPEERAGTDRVAIISTRLWRQLLGGSSSPVGSAVRIDGTQYLVIGVMPPGFVFPDESADVWLPFNPGLTITATDGGGRAVSVPQFPVICRVLPGWSRARAEAKVNEGRSRRDTPLVLVSLHEALMRPVRSLALLLQASVILVLAIACANVAGLLLAEGFGRAREFATRLALGASRWQLVRQLLAEAVILSLVAAITAIAVGRAALQALQAAAGSEAPQIQAIGLDPVVFGFGAILALLAGIGAALVPALRATRIDPVAGLKGEQAPNWPRRSHVAAVLGGGRAFVGGQLVVAVVLLIVSISLIASLVDSIAKRPAYTDSHIMTAELRFVRDQSRTFATRQAVIGDVVDEARRLPGVDLATFATALPLPVGISYFDLTGNLRESGDVAISDAGVTRYVTVGTDYFKLMGLPLIRGRSFMPTDASFGRSVVVVSRAFGEERFGSANPLRRTVSFLRRDWEIMGVVDDVRDPKSNRKVPLVYCSLDQLGYAGTSWTRALTSFTIAIKAGRQPDAVFGAFQTRLRRTHPDLIVGPPLSMEARLLRSMGPLNFYGAVMTGLAILALGLAGLGIFALMSRSVVKRSKEIGIRLALGAEPSGIFTMVVRDGMLLGAVALCVGLPLSFAAHGAVRAAIFGVHALDVRWVAVSAAVLAAVLLLACGLPARRACRFHPVECLRTDG